MQCFCKSRIFGVIGDPLFEDLGSLATLEGQNFFGVIITFYLSAHASILRVFEKCPLS